MRCLLKLSLPLMALILMCLAVAPAQGASSGVQDDGHFFKEETVTQANALIHEIQSEDDRNVLVVTYEGIPDNLLDEYKSKQQGNERNAFFAKWAIDVGKKNGVSGIVILMTRDPGHLQIAVGNKTSQKSFTVADRDELDRQMLASLKQRDYDGALLGGLRFIKDKMDQHPSHGAVMQGSGSNSGASTATGAGSSTNTPNYSTPSPTPQTSPPAPVAKSSGFGIGGLLCVGVVILAVVIFIISRSSGNRGNIGPSGMSPTGGNYPPGNYGPGNYPQQGGGYPQGGVGYPQQQGRSGGGFGSGLLGGLLGGAAGAWGYDKLTHRSDGGANVPPVAGGGGGGAGGDFGGSPNQADTSYSSTGGDFDSSSSTGGDFNSGSSDSSSGSDFGSSTGGDFGGGGGDSGGGGGGDSGGGGGDF